MLARSALAEAVIGTIRQPASAMSTPSFIILNRHIDCMVGSSSPRSSGPTGGGVRRALALLTIAFALVVGAGFLCYESDDGSAAVDDVFTVDGLKYKVLSDPSGETPGTVQVGDGANTAYSGSSAHIEIPSSVVHGDETFSVVVIGENAFWYLGLKTVTIPEGVTHIGDRAFFRCHNLESIVFPEGVVSTGVYIFDGCKKLASVSLPDSLTTIGNYTFSGCSGLASIAIPANTTSVGIWAFNGCTSLASLPVDEGNPVYKSVNGVVFDKAGTTLIHHPNGRAGDYTVPAGVTAINDRAFHGSAHLTSVSIPDSVVTIGQNAFNGCTSLASVSMSANVNTIAPRAFFNCRSLATAPLTPGIYSIGNCAFNNCTSLSSVNIPAGVTGIAQDAFDGCTGLMGFVVDPANTKYSSDGGVLFNKSGSKIVTFPAGVGGVYEIPDGVTEIGGHAFYKSNLHTLIISDNVTSVGSDLIYSSTISAIRIPDGIAPGTNKFSGLYRADGTLIGESAEQQAEAIGRSFVKIDKKLTMVPVDHPSRPVSYDLRGGTGAAPVQDDVMQGFAFEAKPYEGTKTGYLFSGWSCNGDSIGAGDIVVAGGVDIVLAAVWTPITYTVAFDANGGEGEMDGQTHTYGNPLALAANGFSKIAYTFDGWNTAADGTGTCYEGGATVSDLSAIQDSTVTLYAQWAPTQYPITYDLGGGSNSASNPATYDIEDEVVTFASPARTGYVFGGWYSDEAATTPMAQIAAGSHGDVTVYAKWAPITYTVSFDANTGTGSMDSISLTYDVVSSLPANTFSKTGNTFVRWATVADGTGNRYTDGAETSNLSAVDGATVTLYAQWTDRAYEVSFSAAGGTEVGPVTAGHGMTIDAPVTTRAGYALAGWFTEASCENEWVFDIDVVENGFTLYAKWTLISYSVSFDGNGGAGTMTDQPMTYDSPVALTSNSFTRSGYAFSGWNLSPDGTGAPYVDGATISNLSEVADSTVTMYAQWTLLTYAVSYNLNDGSNNGSNPSEYTVEDETISFASPTRNGYDFAGWFADAAFETAKSSIPSGSTGDLTVHAKWIIIEYEISYNLNGGVNGSNPANYTIESGGVSFSPATKEGSAFGGWFSDEGLTERATGIAAGSTGAVAVYARWITLQIDEGSATLEAEDGGCEVSIDSEIAGSISSKDVTVSAPSWKVEMPSGASAGLFDAGVSISIAEMDAESLPEAVRDAASGKPVFSLVLTKDDTPYGGEFGAPVKVTVKYTPSEGEDLSSIAVFCVNDDGTFGDECSARYFTEDEQGYLEFTVPHFSYWMLSEATGQAGSSESDGDGGALPIVIGIVVALAAVAGAAFFIIRRKNAQ